MTPTDPTTPAALPLRYHPADAEVWRDPYPFYRRLRDEDPVHKVGSGPRSFWVLSRFAEVFAAANNTETFSSARGLTYSGDEITDLGLAPTLVMMDKPRHTSFRRLVNSMFTPRVVAKLEPSIRTFTSAAVERLAAMGEADFVTEVSGPLPGLVVASYLGVPEADRARFGVWANAIVTANAGGNVIGDAAEAVGELYSYFSKLIDWRRADPGDDMLSVLASSEVDGRPVSVEEILGFCFVMIAGGNDTAAGLLSGMAALLTEYMGERRRIIDDPGLVAPAVEELLRMTTPVQGLSRTTMRPVEIEGTTVPAGVKVHLLFASANRDPREFGPDAETLDVSRRAPRMLTFSSGPHHCLGAAAARLQGRVVLEELLRVVPDFVADASDGRIAPGPFTRRFESLPIRVSA
ncbi:MAG TPA: cytochrome P450 [Acidimicrobiales bacterium]|nr:cytochrome P450 [Acidimicrobiales bacterium]